MKDTDSQTDKSHPLPVTQMVASAGRTIFEQGMPSFQAFYIEEGRVEVTVREGAHVIKLAELGPGDIFGEMGVLEHEIRMATVTALENTTVSVFKREELEERINNIDDKFVRALIAALIKRLRAATRSQIQHYSEMADLQDKLLGLAKGLESGIDAKRRAEFADDILPLLDAMAQVVEKYKR